MSTKTIYDALTAAGLTPEGACGLLGNMTAESGLRADIAQRGTTALSDAQYTDAADRGSIPFARDGVGYGLCQWTWPTRKAALLAFAGERGVSVGDEAMQVQFCIRELREDFPGVWRVLTSSHDLYECARIVCVQYERPAVNNIDARHAYAQRCFRELSGTETPCFSPDLSVLVLQAVMRGSGCDVELDGRKSADFFAKLRKFTADMEAC
ncbi:MAG: hypothetical protein K6F56_09500 [Oscillospiraceae bacterium]|nr:hypothetical protein [Oscillospiraceae bacterium]